MANSTEPEMGANFPEGSLHRAFVDGARFLYWQMTTQEIPGTHRGIAEDEAVRRYGVPIIDG